MYLETERLVIRSINLADENAYIKMASDGSLDKDIFYGRSREYHEWMNRWIKEAIEAEYKDNIKEWLAYTIEEKKRGIPIGSLGCTYYEDLEQTGLVYFVGAEYRGNGYAAEAVAAYAKYFIECYNESKIIVNIRAENKSSCRTAEKAGFLLAETKMYKDFSDDEAILYNFYEKM